MEMGDRRTARIEVIGGNTPNFVNVFPKQFVVAPGWSHSKVPQHLAVGQ